MATNLNTLVTINEMKKRSDVRDGKLVDEGTINDVVGKEMSFPQTPITFDSGGPSNESGLRRKNRLEAKLPKLDFPSFDGNWHR